MLYISIKLKKAYFVSIVRVGEGGGGHENVSFSKGRHDRESLRTTA